MNTILLSLVLVGQLGTGGRTQPSDLMMAGPVRSSASDLMMAGNVAAATAKRPLHFYGPTWCPNCPGILDTVVKELGQEFDIKVYKDYSTYPAWVLAQGELSGWGYPMVHWLTNTNVGMVMAWSGIDEFRRHDGVAATVPNAVHGGEAAPTPGLEVERVIGLLPRPQIGFVEYGCGDARWCIAAVERWGCRATGVEIDPARATMARERVQLLGLSHLITIIQGDATTTNVEADVGAAYLYADVLEQLRPRLQKLRAFASYMHRPPGLPVVQTGKSWLYVRGQQQQQSAVWQGQNYSQPVCTDPGCNMCNSIRQQLNYRGMPNPPQHSIWRQLF